LRRQRLELILKVVINFKIFKERKMFLLSDETGDPKKGKATDYVARQYLGLLGKIDNSIVAVVSYGLISQGFSGFTHTAYSPLEREQSRSLRNPTSFNVK
jgi:SRSO17 transposase